MLSYAAFVLRHRWGVLIALLLITVGFALSMTRAVVNTSLGGLFLGEHPDYARYLERSSDFGSDNLVLLGIEDPEVLSPAGQARLGRAIAEIRRLPRVVDVRSVLDIQQIKYVSSMDVPDDGSLEAFDGGGGGGDVSASDEVELDASEGKAGGGDVSASDEVELDASEGKDGGIVVRNYARWALDAPEELPRVMEALENDPYAGGMMISRDGRHSAVIVELEADSEEGAEGIPQLVKDIKSRMEAAGYNKADVHVVGLPASISAAVDETYKNIKARFPLVLFVLLATVWVMFRRLWPVAVTGTVAIVSVIWTMGFGILLERQVSVLTGIVPGVVLIIAFSDVIHLSSAYLLELGGGLSKEGAIRRACGEVGRACVLTSATTFLGFVSLSLVPTPVSRTVGLILGFGTAAALLLAITLSPLLFSFFPEPKPWREGTTGRVQDLLDRFLAFTAGLTSRRPWWIVGIFAMATIGMGFGLKNLTLETDFIRRMAPEHPLRQDDNYFRSHFVSPNMLQIYVSAPEGKDLLDPETFSRIADYQEALSSLPDVDHVTSLVDLIAMIHKTFSPDVPGASADPRGELLPDTRAALAQYLLVFEMSGGKDLDRLIDYDRREMLLRVHLKSDEFRQTAVVGNTARKLGQEILGDSARAEPTGLVFLLGDFFEEILQGQKRALLLVFFLISVVMMVGLRSIRAGLWSMVPNAIPLLFLGGYLGLAWDYVDSDVLIVGMIAIGIGVDDTIHFVTRYRSERASGADPETAIQRTFTYAGRGIVITTVILVLGFAPFALSDYLSTSMLGTLLPLTLTAALLADLFLLPALVRLGAIRFGTK